MFFKKKKINIKKKNKTPYFLSFIGVILIIFLGFSTLQAVSSLNFKVFNFANPERDIFSGGILDFTQSSTSAGDVKGTIYILLTGRGGGNHDAPNLTDTLILAGINPNNESITLFSIPRDLYVKYPDSIKKGKINEIYEHFSTLGEDEAMKKLEAKISEITGKDIDFYINIDFNGFIQIVDTLGGVEVTLEKNFVDYQFPDGKLGYKTFILRKGTWILDGEVALMYARSRHSSSDFDRSLRQQIIISALKKKVLELGYFKDRKKILELYTIFDQYISTDMSISDMVKIGLMMKNWKKTQTLSFNLNDSCFDGSPDCSMGGFLYIPLREYFGGASVLLPNGANKFNISQYEVIQNYVRTIYDHSNMYVNPKNIVIFNATKTPFLAGDLADKLRPYGFFIDKQNGTKTLREKKFEKSILYYNNIEEDDETLLELKKFINIPTQKVSAPIYSGTGTHIEIILADKNSF